MSKNDSPFPPPTAGSTLQIFPADGNFVLLLVLIIELVHGPKHLEKREKVCVKPSLRPTFSSLLLASPPRSSSSSSFRPCLRLYVYDYILVFRAPVTRVKLHAAFTAVQSTAKPAPARSPSFGLFSSPPPPSDAMREREREMREDER